MLKREFLSWQFMHFLLSGGVAAAANFLSRLGFQHGAGMDYHEAIVCAYLVGMAVAFTLFRQRVFSPGQHSLPQQGLRFALVNGLAIIQTLAVSLVLADHVLPGLGITWLHEEIAHAAGIAVPIFTSFLGHKYFTFHAKNPGTSA